MGTMLFVAFGGFIGSVCRYLMATTFKEQIQSIIPFPTMIINLSGSLVIGILLSLIDPKEHANYFYLLIPGFLGGFTTYSAFAGETVMLLNEGQYLSALGYVLLTLIGGVLLCAMGMYLGKLIA